MSLYEVERATGSIEVLTYLFVHGASSKTDLFTALKPTHETIARAVGVLERLNLVRVTAEARFPYRQICELTNLGMKVVGSPVHDWPALFWEPDDGTRIKRSDRGELAK